MLPEEIEALKEEEFSFHGSGGFFAFSSERTEEEKQNHREQLLSSVRKELAPLLEEKLHKRKGH